MKPLPFNDEKDLLLRFRDGNHMAFEQIYHQYKAKLIRNSLRLVKLSDMIEELVQDLFIKVWEQRAKH